MNCFQEKLEKIENDANRATLHGELRIAFAEVTKVISALNEQLEYAHALQLKLAGRASEMLAPPVQDIGFGHLISIPAEPVQAAA